MKSAEQISYKQLSSSLELEDYIDSYWEHKNLKDSPNKLTISPDSFFKIIIYLVDNNITAYFLTGLWPKETEIVIPPHAIVYGIKLKILAPEYILQREIASLLNTHIELDLSFWNIENYKFDDFQTVVDQFESTIMTILAQNQEVEGKKLQLTQLLDKMDGDISAEEVSHQITWSNRQINRYINKYLGISLKTYLNIQKVYSSYIQIREGRFHPDKGYFDQAHFIREVKKHTSQTPKELYRKQHDRFIQLKNIQKK